MNIRIHISIFTIAGLVFTLTPSAQADISFTQQIEVEAAGGAAMFASNGEVHTQISGDKSRTESTTKMKSKLLGKIAGDGSTTSIVRLDKALIWNLEPKKQKYSELSFADIRNQMQQTMTAMENAQGSPDQSLPVSAENCSWSESDIKVEHAKGKEKVAGIKTSKHTIRLQQSCTDPETGNTCDLTWVMETWLARKVPGEKEVLAFRRGYAEAIGLDDLMQQVQGPGQGLLKMFSGNWDELLDEFEKMKGYPLRTVMQMGIGGEQCTTTSGNPISMDDMWADASTAAYNAALGQVGSEAGRAIGRSAGEAMGNSVAGSIGGAAVGAAAGELIGGLTGMFRKKKKKNPAVQKEVKPEDQQVTVFRIKTQVTSWSKDTIAGERFEEPVGWKKY